MPKELEPWGGELRMPGWLRWMLRRGPAPADTDERAHERRNPDARVETPLMAVDRAILGPFSSSFPDKRAPRR